MTEENKELRVPCAGEEFSPADYRALVEKDVEEYNTIQYETAESEKDPDELYMVTRGLIEDGTYRFGVENLPGAVDFAYAMCILHLAVRGRDSYRDTGRLADAAFAGGDLEICREFVHRAVKESSAGTVDNSNKAYIPLKNENAEEHIADILGMITDELGEQPDEEYGSLLEDLAPLLEKWRLLKIPKHSAKGAYEHTYEMTRLCFEHKAYKTAARLWGLVYISDDRKKMPNLAKTFLLAGMIMCEQGYAEVAKRCFMLSEEEDTKGKFWKNVPEKYRELLSKDTRLEITDEIREAQKRLDEEIKSGKLKLYTEEQEDKFLDGELEEEVDFPDPEKREEERIALGEKALKEYEKHAGGGADERLKGVDAAFKILTEAHELYEASAYLYFLKANVYLEKGDVKAAYELIKKAYGCKHGNRNYLILLCAALILGKLGRTNEAAVYVFRCYILGSRETVDVMGMVMDELGELPESEYDSLMKDLAKPLDEFKVLEAPKCRAEGAYGLIYDIVEKCAAHKAYRTAAKMSLLLYIAGNFKENIGKTNSIVGKIMSGAGCEGAAKLCFKAAGEAFDENAPEKYSTSGLKFEFEYVKERDKAMYKTREKLIDKAMKIYNKNSTDEPEKYLKGMEEAFKVFKEPQEVYRSAAYMNSLKADALLELGDIEGAYAAVKQAYKCAGGKRSGATLLGHAIVLTHMKRYAEAAAYIFRCYIIFDRRYVDDYVNETAMALVDKYL